MRGKVTFREGERPQLTLGGEANASTLVHEYLGHVGLEELMRDAEHPQAPDQLKADAGPCIRLAV